MSKSFKNALYFKFLTAFANNPILYSLVSPTAFSRYKSHLEHFHSLFQPFLVFGAFFPCGILHQQVSCCWSFILKKRLLCKQGKSAQKQTVSLSKTPLYFCSATTIKNEHDLIAHAYKQIHTKIFTAALIFVFIFCFQFLSRYRIQLCFQLKKLEIISQGKCLSCNTFIF